MKMHPYIVAQGDFLAKIAALREFDSQVVWNDAANDELRAKRSDPNQLVAGDILYVPAPRAKWIPLKIGQENAFSGTRASVKVRLRFAVSGEPLAHERYVVEGEDEDATPKATDGDGVAEMEVGVTTNVVRVRFVDRREIYTARIGHLDPADELSGARHRLAALGAFGRALGQSAPGEGVSDETLSRALRVFQMNNEIAVTGSLDKATSAKLVELHGS